MIVEVVWFLDMNDLNFCINRSATENLEIFWKLSILSTFLQRWVYGSYLIRAADIMRWCDFACSPNSWGN